MKYISAEQFNQADKKVQDSIMEWYKKNAEIGDLVSHPKGIAYPYLLQDETFVLDFINGYMGIVVPLLTTQQLIDYIEWRTGYGIEKVKFGAGYCYWIEPYFESDYSMDQETPRWYYKEMSFCDEELIKALWKCACEVATDDYYN